MIWLLPKWKFNKMMIFLTNKNFLTFSTCVKNIISVYLMLILQKKKYQIVFIITYFRVFPLILDISKEIKFSDIRDEFGFTFTDINGCCETAKWRVHGAYPWVLKQKKIFFMQNWNLDKMHIIENSKQLKTNRKRTSIVFRIYGRRTKSFHWIKTGIWSADIVWHF